MATTLTPKTAAELLTSSGAGAGTCVNAQGWIQPSAAPRFDHDPVTKAAKGLLIETGRTNLIGYGSRLELWGRNSLVSVVPDADIAPNGRYDASKVVLDVGAVSGTPFVSGAITKAAVATQYTMSAYFKAGGLVGATFMLTGTSASDRVNFELNLETKTVVTNVFGGFTGASSKVVEAGNGWIRVECTVTSDTGTGAAIRIYPKVLAGSGGAIDGVNGIYVWGVQLEEGSFATSVIPSLDTFTGRGSVGSYYDATGVMRMAEPGVARMNYEPSNLSLAPTLLLEKAGANLLRSTSNMHLAPWSLTGAARATGKLAPDGTLRAVEVSGASTSAFVYTSVPATGTVMTFSLFVKNVSRSTPIKLLLRNRTTASNFTYGYVNLNQPVPNISGDGWVMQPIGNGWYRCAYTQRTGIAVGNLLDCYAGFSGAEGDNGAFQVWGAQLEAGAYASSYMPSADSFSGRVSTGTYFDSTGALKVAAGGAARLSYNPADLSIAPWVMFETESANLFTESEFRNGITDAPSRSGVTATTMSGFAGAIQFPEGGTATIYASKTPALQPLTTYTISAIFEMDDGQPPTFVGSTGVAGNTFVFAVANVGLPTGSYAVQSLGGSRWRVSATYTTPSQVPQLNTGVYRYAQNQKRGFKVTAYQIEQAAFASSYIPTTTTAVTRTAEAFSTVAATRATDTQSSGAQTRSADSVRIDASKGWLNPSEGTFVMDFSLPKSPEIATRSLLDAGNTSTTKRMGLSFTISGNISGYSNVDGSGGTTAAASVPGPTAKVSFSYGQDGVRVGRNGGALSKAGQPLIPPVTHVGLGCTSWSVNQPCFHIRDFRYYPQRLTDDEVVALTA